MTTLDRLTATLADRYRLDRELGQGGMATVYLAHDRKHDRRVALKVLRAELAQALGAERFLREIKIAARLDHPHILALFDSGDADGFLYYAMPFVDGESLRDRMTREGLRSDRYSLGCVLFEMLAGAAPFTGSNAQALRAKRFTEDAPRLVTMRASVPRMIELVVARALARDPAERHATISEFGAALLAELSGSSAAAVLSTHGAVAPQQRVPLIGREKELGEARAFLERLSTGKGGVLLIGGEPGVGKTARASGSARSGAKIHQQVHARLLL